MPRSRPSATSSTSTVRWRPFELNPDVPREGISRRDYRIGKFGSWERSLELDAQVKAAGAGDELDFRHALQERTPNTLPSHALLALAADDDRQGAVAEALFGAYFRDGRDIGDVATLVDIGADCGLDAEKVRRAVTDEAALAALHAEAQGYARGGVNGVPSVLVNGFLLYSGAQSPAAVASALREAAAHDEVRAAGRATSAT